MKHKMFLFDVLYNMFGDFSTRLTIFLQRAYGYKRQVRSLLEDGNLMPKYLEVGTYYELCFIIYLSFYFI
jgi:hypothetical protein